MNITFMTPQALLDALRLAVAEEGPHTHTYRIVLLDECDEAAEELQAFEAPCPAIDRRPTIVAILQALRDAADEFESAHADILDRVSDEPAKGTPDVPGPQDIEYVVDLLGLADVTVAAWEVRVWTEEQRAEAASWAAAVHLSASDNDHIEVPARPEFLPTPDVPGHREADCTCWATSPNGCPVHAQPAPTTEED